MLCSNIGSYNSIQQLNIGEFKTYIELEENKEKKKKKSSGSF